MFTLEYNGREFDLDSTSMPVEWINSWFVDSDNRHNSDFTWEFELPYTPRNKSILGPLSEPQLSTEIGRFIMCELSISGDVRPVRLYVENSNLEGFRVRCLLNEGSYDVMEKDLNELDLTLDSSISVSLLTNAVFPDSFHNAIYPDAEVCWPPLISQDFLSDQESTYNGVINSYSSGTGTYLNNYLDVSTPINRNAMAPQPFLCWILERGFKEMGLTPKGEAWDSEFIRRMFIYSNHAVEDFNPQTADITSASYNNVSGQVHPMSRTVVNGIDFTSGTNFNTTTDLWTVQTSGVVDVHLELTFKRTNASNPAPENVRFVMYNLTKGVASGADLTGEGESLADGSHVFDFQITIPEDWDTDSVRFFLSDDLGLSISITAITVDVNQQSEDDLNEFGTFDGFPNGLPSMTFGELLASLGKPPFGLQFDYDFNEKAVIVSFKADALNATEFEGVDSLGHPNVERSKAMYHWRYDEPDDDRFLEDVRPNFLDAGAEIIDGHWTNAKYEPRTEELDEILQEICPLAVSLGGTKRLRIEVHAQSERYETEGEAPKPRVGFYLGKVDGVPRADVYFLNQTGFDLEYYHFDHTASLSMFNRTIIPWLSFRTRSTTLKIKLLVKPAQLAKVVFGKQLKLKWGPALLRRASTNLENHTRAIELDAEVEVL